MKDGFLIAKEKMPSVAAERFPCREFTDVPTVVKYITAYNKLML